ncbi:MAG TPA: AMP-binding protein [Dongiaceae bacterium]|jgi:acyl-coenzyme A synthetase/AMP-(fatty) acid ligase
MAELIRGFQADRAIAYRKGAAITQAEFLADALASAAALPDAGFAINLCEDRYNFLVAFAAAIIRGQTSLFPGSPAAGMLDMVAASYPTPYLVHDGAEIPSGLPAHILRCGGGARASQSDMPAVDPERIVLHAFSSGSTGTPQTTLKSWRALAAGADALARRSEWFAGKTTTVIATVPSGHSYGYETTIAPQLFNGTATEASRPLFPADVRAALAKTPTPCCLVTTPVHLRALVLSSTEFPPLDLIMCATAPLSADLARRAEERLGARLLEIYGCTESGFIATRWPVTATDWQVRDDMTLRAEGGRHVVRAEFLPQPVPLADVIEMKGADRFRLMGRSADIVNIAGKKASLAGLSRTLLEIAGVRDGVIFVPDGNNGTEVQRLTALVVAAGATQDEIRQQLRQRMDPAFVPRQIILVDELPRNATGKLPMERLRAIAARAV